MRWRWTRAGGFALLTAAALGGCASSGSGQLDIRARTVAGRELRLIVTTSRSYRPLLSHSSKTADVKGWLVTIDLASDGPLAERARIVGPLWDVPNARAVVSFHSGSAFTRADALAARAMPDFVFDLDGTLWRMGPNCGRKPRSPSDSND